MFVWGFKVRKTRVKTRRIHLTVRLVVRAAAMVSNEMAASVVRMTRIVLVVHVVHPERAAREANVVVRDHHVPMVIVHHDRKAIDHHDRKAIDHQDVHDQLSMAVTRQLPVAKKAVMRRDVVRAAVAVVTEVDTEVVTAAANVVVIVVASVERAVDKAAVCDDVVMIQRITVAVDANSIDTRLRIRRKHRGLYE